MASLAVACRLSARLLSGRAAARSTYFSTSSHSLAAQNFIMPALSPTMTEGNIMSWKVKEGEAFSAGDVLLEIETDKATMDVEAQDDGIMMKITSGDGAKAVQVGTRIAVLAEAGDDISALELPAADTLTSSPSSPSSSSATQQAATAAAAAAAATSTSASASASSSSSSLSSASSTAASASTSGGIYEHSYPLLPSVGQLVKQNGLSKDDVARIRGTGPQGRLLKGDVLAHLGAIRAERPEALSAHFRKLSHLDLANIKVAARAPAPAAAAAAKPQEATKPKGAATVEIDLPVNCTPMFQLRFNARGTIGPGMFINDMVNRAVQIANRESKPPSLWDQLLGLDRPIKPMLYEFVYPPDSRDEMGLEDDEMDICEVLEYDETWTPARHAMKKRDIIDVLAFDAKAHLEKKKRAKAKADERVKMLFKERASAMASSCNRVLSVAVPPGDKKKAKRLMERVKYLMEKEPARLVTI